MFIIYNNTNGAGGLSLGTLLRSQSSQNNEGNLTNLRLSQNESENQTWIQPQGGTGSGIGEIMDCVV